MNKKSYSTLLLCLVPLLIYFACQKDDAVTTEQSTQQKVPKIETISYDDSKNTIFNNLKNRYNLENHKASALRSKSTTDTLGLIIETDIIKQVTLGDYTSYTMKIVDQDSLVFYNLTIEYKNGESDMFITKYTPTEYWLNNKEQPFEGTVKSRGVKLTLYTDPEEAFDEDLVNNNPGNPDLGSGVGGGSGAVYSTDYPVGCLGTVVVTTELVPYPCGCGDLYISECTGCETASPKWPGYNQTTLYYCDESSWVDDPLDPGDNDNVGGVTDVPIPDEPAITTTIKPEECTEYIDGDTDGDCILSEHERCIKDNYPTTICDCVQQGSTIADCLYNPCSQLKAVTDVPLINTRLYQLRTTWQNFEKGFKVSKNPNNSSYLASDMRENNTGNCTSVRIAPHGYTSLIAHSHPSCVGYKMFSAEDILKLANMATKVQSDTNSTVQLTELTHIIVFNDDGLEGTFAIRFDNEASVQALQNIANNEKDRKEFIKDLEKDYRSDFDNFNGTENTTIAKQQEHFFNHLEKYNLNISLYEGILDENNKVDHWKKINKDTLEQEDCN